MLALIIDSQQWQSQICDHSWHQTKIVV